VVGKFDVDAWYAGWPMVVVSYSIAVEVVVYSNFAGAFTGWLVVISDPVRIGGSISVRK